MIGYLIVGGIVAAVILCLLAFARFIAWKDSREMAEASRTIHHVRQGAFNSPYASVKW